MDPSVLSMQALVLENSIRDLMRYLNLHYQKKDLVELTGGDIDDLERCIYKLERDLRDLINDLRDLINDL